MRPQRDSYAEVGQAMRHSIEVAARAALGERDRRVHLAVLQLTASWSRLSDHTSLKQIAGIAYGLDPTVEVTGWHRKRVAESLRKLAALDVVAYASGRGPGARCVVGIDTGPYDGVSLEGESHPAARPLERELGDESHPAAGPEVAQEEPCHRASRTLPPRESHPATAATPRSSSENPSEELLTLSEGESELIEVFARHHSTPTRSARRQWGTAAQELDELGATAEDVDRAYDTWRDDLEWNYEPTPAAIVKNWPTLIGARDAVVGDEHRWATTTPEPNGALPRPAQPTDDWDQLYREQLREVDSPPTTTEEVNP